MAEKSYLRKDITSWKNFLRNIFNKQKYKNLFLAKMVLNYVMDLKLQQKLINANSSMIIVPYIYIAVKIRLDITLLSGQYTRWKKNNN